MSAILLTPPALEPVSLADAKHFLRVEHDDDDDVIAALIAGARVHVEAQTRRALIAQAWRLTRDVWPARGALPILPVPLVAVTAVAVYRADGTMQTVDVDTFHIDKISAPAILAFERGALPVPGRLAAGIEIDIDVGYGAAAQDVPQPLRQVIGRASITVNIATPDADSFRRSEIYLTGQIARAVARGQRGL